MLKMTRVLVAGIAVLWAQSALAQDKATPEQAKALLDKAVAELQMDGPEKAFAQFNDPKSGYTIGELYVFVFDLKGKYEASGANPSLTGTDAHDLHDAEGKFLVREMIALAKSKGHGRVDYVWLNRADNQVEKKRSLVQRVGDHIVGVGYYLN
ncbi:MAG TPA: cache domain-containing protein [Candidatus Sulfotelmatobacter sp.]|jgi:cytochrome c|nr:cache domain-containing protein [Candidatus Sulfotelmatobacter sp.]